MSTTAAAAIQARGDNPPREECASVREALHRYWGYESFRPGQEDIVRSIASGRDACVVMPTGGGKSLCYQLPAVLDAQRTAVVVSPLIALMQDQVAQLEQMGIAADFLNSSLASEERSLILRRASEGHYRLLYLSPERIALDGTPAWLGRVPVSFFAIDEAHCISEWGHDFRPEYRQLSRLRELFPDRPIAAFTASATQRVRHDIIEQLRLRDPHKHIASFRRPNLRYIVKQCNAAEQLDLLVKAIRRVSEGSIIVYSPTIARVDESVDFLEENGIAAIGYHGKMDARTRRRNQEKWMTDEVRVLVGTLAFGLGINKLAVRSVIHLALPKTIEQYYQESGRAGRDGLPAECFLLWQYKDSNIHAFFNRQISDPVEYERAKQRFAKVEGFVASFDCRQAFICRHFGELPRCRGCGKCDACSGYPDWLHSSATPKRNPRRSSRGNSISSRSAELPVPDATTSSARTTAKPPAEARGDLKQFLREWRLKTARQRDVSAFIIMYDTTLDALCAAPPSSLRELRRVPGFGDKKVGMYGEEILAIIRRFC